MRGAWAVVLLAGLLAGCGSKRGDDDEPTPPAKSKQKGNPTLRKAIIGTWDNVDHQSGMTRVFIRFEADGTYREGVYWINNPSASWRKGTYQFIDDDVISLSMPGRSDWVERYSVREPMLFKYIDERIPPFRYNRSVTDGITFPSEKEYFWGK